ncbi:hypothetical protein niasHT_013279 [Heterodera trifolii]|uniref:BTB domain-containing protein n=1 Tax=Heterodera trifolii TaxID=157864 RepID=A0ABD2LAJ7_9BILA
MPLMNMYSPKRSVPIGARLNSEHLPISNRSVPPPMRCAFSRLGNAGTGSGGSPPGTPINKRQTNFEECLAKRLAPILTGAFRAILTALRVSPTECLLLLAHKAILAHASEEFASIFCSDNAKNSSDSNGKKSTEIIKTMLVTYVPIEAFKVMLNFIYTEDLKGLTAQNLLDVLFTAKKYKIIGLINACVAFPVSKLSNVFEVIAKARVLDMDFAQCCMQYIDENAHDLFLSKNFLQIDNKFLTELLSRDQLKTKGGELEIWKAAIRWADAQCRRNGTECSAKNRRDALGQALFEIRFPLIKKEDFSLIIEPSGVLTSQEVISVYEFDPNLLPAHKAIISVASDPLEALFRFETSKMDDAAEKTSNQSIEIKNISIPVFNVLLQFIYADDFNGLNGQNWTEVIRAAKMYEINGLVKACVTFPISKLPNIFEAVDLARFLDLEEFANRCLDYIDANLETLLITNGFLQIDQQFLCEFFGRETLQIGEISLWNAVLKCRTTGPKPQKRLSTKFYMR